MTTLRPIYADFHIHIGRTESGDAVKITGSRDLTFRNIAEEASERKGIGLIGIIDCHSPKVQAEIEACLDAGDMAEVEGGGIRYLNTTMMLGAEIEVREPEGKAAHLLCYLPTLARMKEFTAWLARNMTNVNLSSQRLYAPSRELQNQVYGRGGIVIPAHIFTPYKSIYGGHRSMEEVLDPERVEAVELGLSSDTEMAGWLSELDRYPFLTNSDAHSLAKIGREYNRLLVREASFDEWVKALHREEGRRIDANYGLNPRLGKYHRSHCGNCESTLDEQGTHVERCPYCGSGKLVRGVNDRIRSLADRTEPLVPEWKPPYRYQVPLEFIPGLGKRLIRKLLDRFGTEMNILHQAAESELGEVVGAEIANLIALARQGELALTSGGGGVYGKVSMR